MLKCWFAINSSCKVWHVWQKHLNRYDWPFIDRPALRGEMFKIFEKGRTLYGGTEHFMGGFDNLLETMEQLLKKIVLPSRRGGGEVLWWHLMKCVYNVENLHLVSGFKLRTYNLRFMGQIFTFMINMFQETWKIMYYDFS